MKIDNDDTRVNVQRQAARQLACHLGHKISPSDLPLIQILLSSRDIKIQNVMDMKNATDPRIFEQTSVLTYKCESNSLLPSQDKTAEPIAIDKEVMYITTDARHI